MADILSPGHPLRKLINLRRLIAEIKDKNLLFKLRIAGTEIRVMMGQQGAMRAGVPGVLGCNMRSRGALRAREGASVNSGLDYYRSCVKSFDRLVYFHSGSDFLADGPYDG